MISSSLPDLPEMEDQEDFYAILGLQAGLEGGTEASAEAIRKAYRAKALICHPDKRPDDPLAAAEFQRLQKAYDVLSDEKARKAYDDLLNVRKARLEKENRADWKRRKMMDDLKKRENAFDAQRKEKDEEERAFKRLQAEIARIRATRGQKGMYPEPLKPENSKKPAKGMGASDKEKILKVSWLSVESGGNDYSAVRLKDIFGQFGRVEDIVIRPKNATKQSSALVVMNSRAEVIAATKHRCGDLTNPLLVVPLVAHSASSSANTFEPPPTASAATADSSTPGERNLGNIVGTAYHDYEDSILKKMRKKAEQLKSNV